MCIRDSTHTHTHHTLRAMAYNANVCTLPKEALIRLFLVYSLTITFIAVGFKFNNTLYTMFNKYTVDSRHLFI